MSPDPAQRELWLKNVRIKHARDEGWNLEDTQMWIEGTPMPGTTPAATATAAPQPGGGQFHGVPSGCNPNGGSRPGYHEIRFEFRNTSTGEAGLAGLQTNDDRAISPDPAQREFFLRNLRAQHAREKMWQLEHTQVWIQGTPDPGATAPTGAAPQPASQPGGEVYHGVPAGCQPNGGPGRGQHSVHIQYCNTSTGENGAAEVQTNDDRAVSADPAQRALWLTNIRAEYSRENGWNLEHIQVWIEGTSPPSTASDGAAAQGSASAASATGASAAGATPTAGAGPGQPVFQEVQAVPDRVYPVSDMARRQALQHEHEWCSCVVCGSEYGETQEMITVHLASLERTGWNVSPAFYAMRDEEVRSLEVPYVCHPAMLVLTVLYWQALCETDVHYDDNEKVHMSEA